MGRASEHPFVASVLENTLMQYKMFIDVMYVGEHRLQNGRDLRCVCDLHLLIRCAWQQSMKARQFANVCHVACRPKLWTASFELCKEQNSQKNTDAVSNSANVWNVNKELWVMTLLFTI
jgi:hypothetical protein